MAQQEQTELAQAAKDIAGRLMDKKYANSDMHTILELAAMEGMLFAMERARSNLVASYVEPTDQRFAPQSAGC